MVGCTSLEDNYWREEGEARVSGGNDFVSGVRGHCLTIAFNRPPFQFCTKLILTAVLYVVALVTYRAPSNAIKAMELLSQMSRLFLEAFTKKGSILFELNQSVI